MPVFEIEANGRRFEVEAPSIDAAVQAMGGEEGMAQRFASAHDDTSADRPELQSQLQDSVPQRGSLLDPAMQGMTFGFADEIMGGIGGVAGMIGGKPFSEGYERMRDASRGNLEAVRERQPVASTVAEIAGAFPTAVAVPFGAAAQGAGMGARIGYGALGGAAAGGVYGAGAAEEGLVDRALGAARGAGVGAVTGAAAPVAISGAQAAIGAARDHIGAPLRGLINRDAEAARRIAVTQQADDAIVQPRLTPADEAAAITSGQPVLNIDRGGEATRALARSAANASPQGRAAMENAVSDRFAGQGDRTIDAVRRIVGGGTTADTRETLLQQATAANRPAYLRAYGDPNAQALWDDGLEQLAGAPVVQDAIRQATVTGRNTGALAGFPPVRNPFTIDRATGRLTLATDEHGNRVLPNLQFWDHVKRNLDAVGTREARQAARVLREHLDQIVPSYRDARAGAARFFGANDALEAGDQFVMSRMANDEARRHLARMSEAERRLFAEGFADSLVRRIAETGDRRNVINSVFLRSRASRERIEMALGRQRARELETFLRVEDLLDRARSAFGNSTTTRQLVELGLAGGSGAYGLTTGDWATTGTILAGLLARRGAARIDRGVAQRIGEMLASDDPTVFQRGLQTVARSDRLIEALRSADIPAALVSGQQGAAAVQ